MARNEGMDQVLVDPNYGGGESRLYGATPVEGWEDMKEDDHRAAIAKLGEGWGVYGDVEETPMFTENEITECDYSRFVKRIKDQNGRSACNAFGITTVFEACRESLGLPDIELSPGDLYSAINGGVDQGSLPQRGLEVMMKNGCATVASVNPLHVVGYAKSPAIVAERAKFRIGEAYWCPTPMHTASAQKAGFFCLAAIFWKNETPDAEGWLDNVGGGAMRGWGGHAFAQLGIKKRAGEIGLPFPNSWTVKFGVKGWGVVPMKRAEVGHRAFRWFAVRSVTSEVTGLPVPIISGNTVVV